HVCRLEEDLGNRGQGEPAQVGALVQTVVGQVVRDRDVGHLQILAVDVLGQDLGGFDDLLGDPRNLAGHDHVKPTPTLPATVGVYGQSGVRVGVVADVGALVDTRPHPVVVLSREQDGGPVGLQTFLDQEGELPGELVFGVPAGGFGSHCVAGLLTVSHGHRFIDLLGCLRVATVVTGIDDDHTAPEGTIPGGSLLG